MRTKFIKVICGGDNQIDPWDFQSFDAAAEATCQIESTKANVLAFVIDL